VNWRRFLHNIERHKVWTLPDESEITRSTSVVASGGLGFIAEALDGLRYHTYEYWIPELYENPEAKAAAAIGTALQGVFSLVKEPLRRPRSP
jgi:hypothetical protein